MVFRVIKVRNKNENNVNRFYGLEGLRWGLSAAWECYKWGFGDFDFGKR